MNILIKDVTAILPAEGGFETKKTDIYIANDLIEGVGVKPEGFIAEKTIDGADKLAIPGLVNCHTHAYMTVFRNLADDLSFDDWLFGSILPLEDKMNGNDAYWGALLGYTEMLKTGTTSFLDMNMFSEDTARAAVDIGIRGVLSRGLVGFGRSDTAGIGRINELKQVMETYKNNSRLSFMIAPHAIYTTDREYLELCLETADALNLPIHIHVSETKKEVDTAYEKYGRSPVEYLDDIGIFNRHTVAAHCVHLSEDDIRILADKKVSIAANIKSNLKLANGYPPIPALVASGCNVCLGTDSAASNNSLNLFADMNYNALLHKGITGQPKVISAAEAFSFATENGAHALGLNAGRLEKGKKADISLLNLANPQFVPRHNLVAALVYSANGSETDTVIVDGEIVLENGRLTKMDETEIYKKAGEALENLQKSNK